jgi:hypothetical protein
MAAVYLGVLALRQDRGWRAASRGAREPSPLPRRSATGPRAQSTAPGVGAPRAWRSRQSRVVARSVHRCRPSTTRPQRGCCGDVRHPGGRPGTIEGGVHTRLFGRLSSPDRTPSRSMIARWWGSRDPTLTPVGQPPTYGSAAISECPHADRDRSHPDANWSGQRPTGRPTIHSDLQRVQWWYGHSSSVSRQTQRCPRTRQTPRISRRRRGPLMNTSLTSKPRSRLRLPCSDAPPAANPPCTDLPRPGRRIVPTARSSAMHPTAAVPDIRPGLIRRATSASSGHRYFGHADTRVQATPRGSLRGECRLAQGLQALTGWRGECLSAGGEEPHEMEAALWPSSCGTKSCTREESAVRSNCP